MIDIHPRQHGSLTGRDFFVHLGIVVLGILIAIGLEQGVEYFHHRHELSEARAALAEEHQENIRRYHANVRDHLIRTADDHTGQNVLRFLLAHPGSSQDQLPAGMMWGSIAVEEPVESAWLTIQHSDVASLLPPAEMRAYAAEYSQLEREFAMFRALQERLAECTSYLTQTADITTLSSDDLHRILNCEALLQSEETVYGDQLSVIGRMKDYGPPLSWWAMIPYFNMRESYNFAPAKLYAATKANEDAALSVLPPDQRKFPSRFSKAKP